MNASEETPLISLTPSQKVSQAARPSHPYKCNRTLPQMTVNHQAIFQPLNEVVWPRRHPGCRQLRADPEAQNRTLHRAGVRGAKGMGT